MSKTLTFQRPTKRRAAPRDHPAGDTRSKAVKLLGISDRLISRAIEMGEIKTITFAGRQYVPHAEIERIKRLFEAGNE